MRGGSLWSRMVTENICDEAKVTNKSHVLLLWSIVIHQSQKTLIRQIPWFRESHSDIFLNCTNSDHNHDLDKQCLNWNWISCLFLLGDHGADVRVGVVKRSREDRRGGCSLYLYFFGRSLCLYSVFFLVDLCICICRFPYKTVLSSGGGLGSEQEGEERRGGHLPCLPWGPGRGRAGSEIVQVGKDQSASLPGWHSGLSLPAASPSGLSHQVAPRPWHLSVLQGKCQR